MIKERKIGFFIAGMGLVISLFHAAAMAEPVPAIESLSSIFA